MVSSALRLLWSRSTRSTASCVQGKQKNTVATDKYRNMGGKQEQMPSLRIFTRSLRQWKRLSALSVTQCCQLIIYTFAFLSLCSFWRLASTDRKCFRLLTSASERMSCTMIFSLLITRRRRDCSTFSSFRLGWSRASIPACKTALYEAYDMYVIVAQITVFTAARGLLCFDKKIHIPV